MTEPQVKRGSVRWEDEDGTRHKVSLEEYNAMAEMKDLPDVDAKEDFELSETQQNVLDDEDALVPAITNPYPMNADPAMEAPEQTLEAVENGDLPPAGSEQEVVNDHYNVEAEEPAPEQKEEEEKTDELKTGNNGQTPPAQPGFTREVSTDNA